jgi:hypothetical protein
MSSPVNLSTPAALMLAILISSPLPAQTILDPSRAAQATQPTLSSDAMLRDQEAATSAGLEQENSFAPETPGDPDIGQQLILKRQEKKKAFSVWADSSGFWTDNAANVSAGETDDYFYVGGINLAWQQRIHGRFYGDVYAGQHFYRYDELSDLDYELGDVAAGFLVLLPELGHSIFHLHYYYQRITQDIDDDAIYESHNIRAGLQKTFLIDRLNSVNIGAMANLALDTEPSELQRHEYSASIGYNFKITRSLTISLSYRAAYFDYFNLDGRQDWYHNAGANLTWRPWEPLEISAGYNYSLNESNRDVFDYEAQLAGPSIALKFRF